MSDMDIRFYDKDKNDYVDDIVVFILELMIGRSTKVFSNTTNGIVEMKKLEPHFYIDGKRVA